ncbi:MAG: NADH-ubiquinone oxidoreductase-F iron-sulfur binding region domain-containing protein [Solirubrobacteraceae bacterium]
MTTVTPELLPRLLLGVGEEPILHMADHVDVHGPLPNLRNWAPERLIELVEAAGIRGHGGASFPAARKMQAVASRRTRAIVVANGSEGEPASKKDRMLMRELPHLVLDGAAVAARAVGAREAIIAVAADDDRSLDSLEFALDERRAAQLPGDPRFELFTVTPRYLSGQETALVNAINGGPGLPTFSPPRPFERGVRRRPTLLQNVETLAHIALVARHGPAWFRELGTPDDPGSTLVTLSGAVAAPGVYEIAHGMELDELLEVAGLDDELTAVLIGGYFGTWLPAATVPGVRLAGAHLREHGASLGAGVIVALGASACPVAETSRIANFFADETAGQCGPCVHGLDAVARAVHELATGTGDRHTHADVERWLAELPRRGACQHPDGGAQFISSSLRTFAADFADHARHGPCDHCHRHVLPTPGAEISEPSRR